MYPIDTVVAAVPALLSDLFRHNRDRLSVFLCGRKPEDRRFDLRFQVKRVLENRMGCSAFLGEDIAELKGPPKPDRDHLTIEVKEAANSDLVVMFLGSAGTLAEVTAFAMDREINPKVVVFNAAKYKDDKSFINLGPLKLLRPDRVIYYDADETVPSVQIVRHLDRILANLRFHRAGIQNVFTPALGFESWVALSLIYATFPVRYQELSELFPWDDARLRQALSELFNADYVAKQEAKYLPVKTLASLPGPAGLRRDVAHLRLKMLGHRISDSQIVADYRLLV